MPVHGQQVLSQDEQIGCQTLSGARFRQCQAEQGGHVTQYGLQNQHKKASAGVVRWSEWQEHRIANEEIDWKVERRGLFQAVDDFSSAAFGAVPIEGWNYSMQVRTKDENWPTYLYSYVVHSRAEVTTDLFSSRFLGMFVRNAGNHPDIL